MKIFTDEHKESIQKFFNRYSDTILYIVTILFVASLFVITSQLKNEIYEMRIQLDNFMEEVKTEDVVENASEKKDGGRLPGDDTPAQWPRLYTDEDAIALAKMLWGEARGVPELVLDNGEKISSECQQAAAIWTVLNRYDAGYPGDSIKDVVAAPNQYHGYSEENPVEDELLDLAYDVLDRWNRERHGETNVGRVLPPDYYWFHGDGTYNHLRDKYKDGSYWNWELTDVYALAKPAGFND